VNAKGEGIYHLPGDRDYEDTRIDPSKGERWFCSEDEAKGGRVATSAAIIERTPDRVSAGGNSAPPGGTAEDEHFHSRQRPVV
jgi:hypothetical protein